MSHCFAKITRRKDGFKTSYTRNVDLLVYRTRKIFHVSFKDYITNHIGNYPVLQFPSAEKNYASINKIHLKQSLHRRKSIVFMRIIKPKLNLCGYSVVGYSYKRYSENGSVTEECLTAKTGLKYLSCEVWTLRRSAVLLEISKIDCFTSGFSN